MSGASRRGEAFQEIPWRYCTDGPLKAIFAAARVKVAAGPTVKGRKLPEKAMHRVIGERRDDGRMKYACAIMRRIHLL
jgi:hypothetical protein